MRNRRLACLVVLAALAACGSTDDATSAPEPTAAVSEPTSTVPSTDAPADTATADTEPTAAASTTSAASAPKLLTKLTSRVRAGNTYVTDESAIGTPITFTMPENGYATAAPGYFSVNRQGSGEETLVTLSDLSQAQVFKDPVADLRTYGGDNATILANTVPAPDDFLAWFSGLPGVTAGAPTETEVLGLPATSMTYTIGDVAGSPCLPNGLPCLLSTFFAAGFTNVYNPGDAGTLYVVDVGGRSVLVDVTSDEGAPALVSAITVG